MQLNVNVPFLRHLIGTPINSTCDPEHYQFLILLQHSSYVQRRVCGACHMASSFLPLSRTTTTAICSPSNLLVATFTQHLASHPTSGSPLTTSLPLPSPLTVTSLLDQKELTPLLALILISIRDALLTNNSLLPSHQSPLSKSS